jgi:hypothetical protein
MALQLMVAGAATVFLAVALLHPLDLERVWLVSVALALDSRLARAGRPGQRRSGYCGRDLHQDAIAGLFLADIKKRDDELIPTTRSAGLATSAPVALRQAETASSSARSRGERRVPGSV